MKKYFFLPRLLILLFTIISLNSCKKNVTGSSSNQPPGNDSLLKTPIGTKVGNPVSATIGADGGTVLSDDGNFSLSIPAGALTGDKTISIQRVTNEIPGGVGFAYDLLPNGTVFIKPARITFHYDTGVLNGGPFSLLIGFQDSAQEWLVDSDHVCHFDTVQSTIGLDIWHFTSYGLSDYIIIKGDPLTLKSGETSEIQLSEVLLDINHPGVIRTEFAPPTFYKGYSARVIPYPDEIIFWRTNAPIGAGITGGSIGGNDHDGHIIGTGNKVTYQAPAHIDYKRKVRVSCRYNTNYRTIDILNEKSEGPINEKGVEISLEPDQPSAFYNVTIDYVWNMISPFNPETMKDIPIYWDKATMDVLIKFKSNLQIEVTVSNIQNFTPSVTPPSKSYRDVTFYWIPDSVGSVNVDTVIAPFLMGPDSTISFIIKHSKTNIPGTKLVYTSGDVINSPPTPMGGKTGYPPDFVLDLKKKGYSYLVGPFTRVTFIPQ